MAFTFTTPSYSTEGLLSLSSQNPNFVPTQYGDLMNAPSLGYYFSGGQAYEPYMRKGQIRPYKSSMGDDYSNFGGFAFKKFTEDAPGIVGGQYSAAQNLPTSYSYAPYPSGEIAFLQNPNAVMQSLGGESYGAGRFMPSGLLGSSNE